MTYSSHRHSRLIKRREYVQGKGIVDSIIRVGRNGIQHLKHGVVNGIKHYVPVLAHKGLDYVLDNTINKMKGSGLNSESDVEKDKYDSQPFKEPLLRKDGIYNDKLTNSAKVDTKPTNSKSTCVISAKDLINALDSKSDIRSQPRESVQKRVIKRPTKSYE